LEKASVLIIEDEIETSILLFKYISKIFTNVYLANDGDEGLLLYQKHKPNIILCDIQMPKINGLELIKIIRKEDLKTRIIIQSAYNAQEEISKAVKLGLDDYLIKPISLQNLKKALLLSNEMYFKDFLYLASGFYWNNISSSLYNKEDHEIFLNKNEKNLLELLCRNKQLFFSKHEIAEHLYEDYSKINGVRTIISRLKTKLSADIIFSVFDQGYKIKLLEK